MKKLNKIMAAFASLALSAAVFTGCVTDNPDLEYLNSAEKVWIIGDTEEFGKFDLTKAFPLEGNEESVFTGEFTATTAGAEFKILIDTNANWDTAFWSGDTTPFFADEKITCSTIGGMSNCVVSLDIGVKYKITVDAINASAPVVEFTAIGGEAATKLSVFANGLSNSMTNNEGEYTTQIRGIGDSLLFTISDGSKSYGLTETDQENFALETEYSLEEVTEASKIKVKDGSTYKFTASIAEDGVISLVVKVLDPIHIQAVPSALNGWKPEDASAATVLVSKTSDKAVYAYEFTAKEDGDAEFKLLAGKTWDDPAYADGKTIAVDDDVEMPSGGANAVLQDLEKDCDYVLMITTTATTVSVKLIKLENVTKMVITLPSKYQTETKIPTIESVIGWGGVVGYWKSTVWTNGKLTDVPVVDGKITLYVTSLSNPADWYNEQKGSYDFKLSLVFGDKDPKNYGSWFKIAEEVTLPETGIDNGV